MIINPEDKFTDYFEQYRTETQLVLDRSSNNQICSIAATGFGFDVLAIRDKNAKEKIVKAIETITRANPKQNRGWLFHFMTADGRPIAGSEVSTIDTAIFYAGALKASRRLKDKTLEQKVQRLIDNVDTKWMIENSPSHKRLCHGLRDNKFIQCEWDEYNEGVIAYRLWEIPFEPTKTRFDLPLFAYYYPLCFINDPVYEHNLKQALLYQQRTYGYKGITSTDTETDYQFLPIGYVSPIALYSVGEKIPFDLSPTVHSYNIKTKWQSNDRIGIDEGAAILMKHRDCLLRLYIQHGI